MIADQNLYDIYFTFFFSYGFGSYWWAKLVRAKHSATAEGENCAYSPTLDNRHLELTVLIYTGYTGSLPEGIVPSGTPERDNDSLYGTPKEEVGPNAQAIHFQGKIGSFQKLRLHLGVGRWSEKCKLETYVVKKCKKM